MSCDKGYTRLSPSIFADCKWLKLGGGTKLQYLLSNFSCHMGQVWSSIWELESYYRMQNYMYLQIDMVQKLEDLSWSLFSALPKHFTAFVKHIMNQFKLSESTSSKFKMQLWSLHTGPARRDMKLLRTPDPLSTFRDGLGTRLVPSLIPFSGSEYEAERTSYPS